jgi:hypothetical protein
LIVNRPYNQAEAEESFNVFKLFRAEFSKLIVSLLVALSCWYETKFQGLTILEG